MPSLLQQTANENRRMNGRSLAEIVNLMTAGNSRCYQNIARVHCSYGGEQSSARNCMRDFVVPFSIAKGARHSAAAGVKIYQTLGGNAGEQANCRRKQTHGLLMAMSVQQNSSCYWSKRQIEACHEFFKRLASGCYDTCFLLRFSA